MTQINPTSGITGITPATQATPATRPQGAQSTTNPFADNLKTALNRVDSQQQQSAVAIQDLLTGRSHDMLPVVSEVAKADLSFKLLIGVRNKVVDAYKQTMNMQV